MVVNTENLRFRLMLSPYYREKLFSAGLTAEDLSAGALSYFPITLRSELVEHFSSILAAATSAELESTHLFASTGTGGRRVLIYRGEPDERRTLRLWEAAAETALPQDLRILFVCTLAAPKEYDVTKYVEGRALSICRRPVGDLSRLEGFDIVTGTPRGLVRAVQSEAAAGIRLSYTTALPLDGSIAAQIRELTPAPHFHCYSMTETGPIARYCAPCGGSYHVFPDMYVETVSGRLCVTKLGDTVFPLLRYLTDDCGDVHCGGMPCGFTGQSIADLRGRKNEDFCP